ncbi:bucentaur or craniofacial development-domain-containing protein [Gloeopeniophorella convolvens]|nr:bucentaur or craniofacial development-domain-containing protein [Gloeopeniophorella convolvens]
MSAPPVRASHDSDSEDDLDYVPEAEGGESDSSSDERDNKRARVGSPPAPSQEVVAAAAKARQELWAKFQDSVNTLSTQPDGAPKLLVKVEKKYRFAGEDVVEVVEVPDDSKDAKKWPLWKPQEERSVAAAPEGASSNLSTPSTPALPSPSPPAAATPKPPAKRPPGRRKPKVQLAELPSASSQKGKKLTTLEKSALDWKAHIKAPDEAKLSAELEANRRSGGYLDKVEFLQRVGDRRNEVLDGGKDNKRRRG